MDTQLYQNEAAQKAYELAISKGFVLRCFEESDYDHLTSIDFMFQDDPLCKDFLKVGELKNLVGPAWKDIINDGLAVGLFNGNDIVAVSLSNDLCTQYSQEPPDVSLQVILEYLDVLDKPFKNQKVFKRGEVLYCFLLGVSREYRGNGFSHVVLAESARQAREKGYKDLYLQATNPLTFKVVQKLFSENKATAELDCQNFTDKNGAKPFANKSVINRGVWANIHS